MVRTSWAVRGLGRTRRATVTLVAVVSTAGISLIVGTAVIPLTAWVIALSLESTPVALENLRIGSSKCWIIYIAKVHIFIRLNENTTASSADLFVWWRAVFIGRASGLGGRRSFQLAWAGDRRGRGATTGPIWVACTRMVNCKRNHTAVSTTWDRLLKEDSSFQNPENLYFSRV